VAEGAVNISRSFAESELTECPTCGKRTLVPPSDELSDGLRICLNCGTVAAPGASDRAAKTGFSRSRSARRS